MLLVLGLRLSEFGVAWLETLALLASEIYSPISPAGEADNRDLEDSKDVERAKRLPNAAHVSDVSGSRLAAHGPTWPNAVVRTQNARKARPS